ncbi:antibiotic biosynthesis monooxygenase family protein [Nocardioides marmorisolisilvae]|uniref:Antibiotic biosynthesis monooxygenase n=1 Tax=Nocardioides marmorisolisilvae TaxID=1542737 RepID=A0A3N0DTW7_9ACTN|nr:antibiotic biosynthesis monooxygenase [Nocardioides marmorisolisilvae]RNL78946.1 antibiotic biosynthesis monooxygenase [Nocardioides marmorisolisilvae]
MTGIAELPEPPYTAVIFSSLRTEGDQGYGVMGARMQELAKSQPGYLGYESARDANGFGITVSYWVDDDAARAWKKVHEHSVAQQRGKEVWYADYQVRVATVQRSYGPGSSGS